MAIFTAIKKALITVLNVLLSWLPNSPFEQFLNAMESNTFLKYLNWIVPISDMIVIGQAWLAAITIFYIYQLILRWVKAIE